MFRVTTSKRATLTALSAGAIMLVASFLAGCGGPLDADGSSSSALNYAGDGGGSGNKAVNPSGYEYVDSTHVNVYFNHQSTTTGEIDRSMFVVKPMTGSTNFVTGMTATSSNTNSGCIDTNLTKGTKVALTLNPLAANTQYKVLIKGTLADDNGLTLGNYLNRVDFSFVLRTPISCTGTPVVCTWSTAAPAVRYSLGDSIQTVVPYEQNLAVFFDRPILPSTLSTFLTALSNNYKKAGTKVTQDSNNSTGHSAVAGGESYTPHSNNSTVVTSNVNTTFFFPEFVQGNTMPVYNRSNPGSNSYVLTVPSFTDVNGHVFSSGLGSISFTTTTSDIPGWLEGRPTVVAGASSGQLAVSWSPTTLDPAKVGPTTGYDVYYVSATSPTDTTNKWAGAYVVGCSTTGAPPATSCTISGLNTALYYYVRVVPKNSVAGAGFSRSNVNAVRPHL